MRKSINKYKSKIMIIVLLLILISIMTLVLNIKNDILVSIKNKIQKEGQEVLSYYIYDNANNNDIQVLVSINTENGIDYIECEDRKIYGNGNSTIVFDAKVTKDEENIVRIKEIGSSVYEKKFKIDDEEIYKTINVNDISRATGYKEFKIENNIYFSGYDVKYTVGNGAKAVTKNYNEAFTMTDYDIIDNNMSNEDGTVPVTITAHNNKTSHTLTITKEFDLQEIETTTSEIVANSLIEAIHNYNLKSGKARVQVDDEIYNLKIYDIQGELYIDSDLSVGTDSDVGTSSSYAQNMVVLRVNGDINIDSNTKLTGYGNIYGGPKGMLIYSTGTTTNNGIITMTARGAKAEGQNVYIWKNQDNSYEFVPQLGGTGGNGVVSGVRYSGVPRK